MKDVARLILWVAHCMPALTIASICAYYAVMLGEPIWLLGVAASIILLPNEA